MPPARMRCRFCCRRFRPNPRAGARQYACSDKSCQRQRKRANQDAWLAANPGYFEGRSAKLRAWREAHPGYSTQYRRTHPEAAERHAARERQRRERARARDFSATVAKQVEIPAQPTEQKDLAPALPRQVEIPPRVAEQVEMPAQSPVLIGLIEKLQGMAKPNHIDLSLEACYIRGISVLASLAARSACHG